MSFKIYTTTMFLIIEPFVTYVGEFERVYHLTDISNMGPSRAMHKTKRPVRVRIGLFYRSVVFVSHVDSIETRAVVNKRSVDRNSKVGGAHEIIHFVQ